MSEEEDFICELMDKIPGYKLGSIGIVHSGDGRSGLYSPVLGVILANADEYNPSSKILKVKNVTMDKSLKEICKKHNISYKKPKTHLCSYVC